MKDSLKASLLMIVYSNNQGRAHIGPHSQIRTNASPKYDGIAAVCWNGLLVRGANLAHHCQAFFRFH